ncbi:uncharacterized protein BXZ73DRAFT_87005 [Epithele typhae]|uniref:uncharacterized protein n=1 Tax=Epithele typhae TaxID=378194 RepID=UPI0020078AAE|nr:uncharacterized protein BXZ73DRAFT_87005 [Epithele typhae]KAH9944032.1 hypothetical protein BXZ73DRAFT_87005 [Epithele typhae]
MHPDLKSLLGRHPLSPGITAYISFLASRLLFKPVGGWVPKTGLNVEDIQSGNLVLDGIDIYNVPPPKAGANASRATKSQYTTYPHFPSRSPSFQSFQITGETTGKNFVSTMGEPDRKGGGAGPSSGSIDIWFGGEESRGPQAWERGKDAVWKVLSVFPPKEA